MLKGVKIQSFSHKCLEMGPMFSRAQDEDSEDRNTRGPSCIKTTE